jgi:hypothetical protein
MKTAGKLILGLALGAMVILAARADVKDEGEGSAKEKTLKGTILCGKCALKETPKCATAIKVKEKGKDVVYYFDPEGGKKYHAEICMEPKEGTVTGKVSEKDGKKMVKVSKVVFKDKE